MKYKILQLILIIGMLVCFYLPMFNVDEQTITGFNAIFSNDILLFGNIILGFIVFLTTVHFVFMLLSIVVKTIPEKYQEGINIVVNLNLIFGLLMITFLGWLTNVVAIMCVVLMIASAYVRYKFL